jgi:DNA-binding transcriptional ArsR family regulator
VVNLTEENEYDEIFAALKHPVRRQILLFIERKGETSFTEIQQETGIDDTGLMSYHLKELTPLVEQSKRGKYCLSEVGQAGVELFRKVERERQKSSVVVRSEVEKYLVDSIKSGVFLLGIIGFTLLVPMSVDILMAVQGVLGNGYSSFQLVGLFLLSLFVMVAGASLFVVYDRHYYSKTLKTSLIHSVAYAIAISIMSILSFYQIYTFNQNTLDAQLHATENLSPLAGILRIAVFLASAPVIVYGLNRFYSRRQNKT